MAFIYQISSLFEDSKSIKLFALGLLIIFIGTQTTFAQFAGGSGTEADPYQISTPAQLDSVRYYGSSHFILINDIDLNIAPFDTGDGWNPMNFNGVFDGNGYEISNLYINRGEYQYGGFFRNVSGPSATIKNMRVIDADVTISWGGVLVGQMDGGASMETSMATGILTGTGFGFVHFEGIGGLIGYVDDGSVLQSFSEVDINIEQIAFGEDDEPRFIGGLIGMIRDQDSIVRNCYTTGNISTSLGQYRAGLVANLWFTHEIIIENNYSTSNIVQGSALLGGGSSYIATNNFWDTETSGITSGTRTGITGKTTSQMKTESTFTNAGWDFNNVWAISSEINDGYPYLRNVNPNLSTSNNPPIASSVIVSGSLRRDSLLTGSYSYTDVDSDPESGTTFKWYSASDTTSDKSLISGAIGSTYSLTSDEVGKFIQFVVFPSDGEITGDSVASAWQGPVSGPVFAGGSGTEADPYQISTPAQLDSVRNHLDKHFILINDIDLNISPYNTGEGWDPIGEFLVDSFTGTLNGKEYAINNLFIDRGATNSIGLFGSIGNNSEIDSLSLVDVNITGRTYSGSLVGHKNGGVIKNVFVSGNLIGRECVGGIAGYNFSGSVTRSFVNVNVQGWRSGGLSGCNNGAIEQSYSIGNVTGTFTQIGGLVGQNTGSISNCYANGNVQGGTKVGGLVGRNTGNIATSYATGTVYGTEKTGGLIGSNELSGSVSNSFWNTDFSNQDSSSGGEVLTIFQMLFEDSYTDYDFNNTWEIYKGFSFPFFKSDSNQMNFADQEEVTSVINITGEEGWRFFATPLDLTVINSILDLLWTQGYTGADIEEGVPNIFIWNEQATDWEAVTNPALIAQPGTGIAMYVFEEDLSELGLDGFPKTIVLPSTQNNIDVTIGLSLSYSGANNVFDPINDGWNLIGNPYIYPIDWNDSNGWIKSSLDQSYYIWNDSANEYQSWNGAIGTLPNDGIIAPFQGFWVKANNTGTPSITITPDARTTGGALLKKAPVPSLNMTISDGVENSSLSSNSTIAFLDHASVGQDDWDAWKLQPMSSDFLSSFTTTNEGASLDINSLPRDLSETVEIPLDYELKTNSTIDELSISWELDHFPSDWSFTLLDQETVSLIDMNSNSSYQFGNVINRKEKSKQDDFIPIHRVMVSSDGKQKGIESSRFIITISPGSALSNGEEIELPSQYFLSQNYPNPFNPTTVINFQLPENNRVSLRVFDMLGREVAMLVNGQVEAGYHSVNFDAGNLASGVYIYRLEAGNQIMTKKMTLIK